jgi:DNA-binding XRE family transcriptional regulator
MESTMATTTTNYHDERLARRLRDDPEFRAEFERQQREIAVIDAVINKLDELRIEHRLSKAELAREIGKNESSIRRLLSAPVNPELRTIVAMADVLDADVQIIPRRRARRRTRAAQAA